MSCPICAAIDHDKYVIYQDKLAVAFLAPEPAADGHVIIAPREHFPIIEAVPDDILQHLFVIANRVSTSVFELLKAEGTNIIVNNGLPAGQDIPHFYVNVIPRKKNDGLNFRWIPRQLTPRDMQETQAKVKDKCDYIGHEVSALKPIEARKVKELNGDAEEVDYRIKQLERVP